MESGISCSSRCSWKDNYAGTPMETATPVLKALCTMYGIPEFQCLDAEGLDDIRNDKEALLADAARRAEALAEVF